MRLSDLVYLIPAFLICVAWIVLWKRAKTRKKLDADRPSEPIDFAVLNEAEREAASQPSMLEQYNERYVPIGKFSTVQAFGEQDMERLVSELAKLEIEARYLLIETMPAGAMTVLTAAGYYQIWVEPRDARKTREFLSQYFGKEF